MLLALAQVKERAAGCKGIRFRQKVMKEAWFDNKSAVKKKGEKGSKKKNNIYAL